MKMLDIKGQRFGECVAVRPTDKRAYSRRVVWECLCDCGDTFEAVSWSLKRGEVTRCPKHRAHDGRFPPFYGACDDKYKREMLHRARGRAVKKGWDFDIDYTDFDIPEACPLLGIPLHHNIGSMGPDSPSIDRIDPTKGYVKGNVWVISQRANVSKNDLTLEEIERLAAAWRKAMYPEQRGV